MTEGKCFASSPFELTANRESAKHWAGRRGVLQSLERICRSMENRPDSSLNLIWANLGAGKSHALYHLSYLLEASTSSRQAITIWADVPEQLRRFLDLYKRLLSDLPLEVLAKEVMADNDPRLPGDLRRMAQVMAHGTQANKELVRQWLLAENPHLRDLRAVSGITQKIEDDGTASEMFAAIVGVFARRKIRFVVLLDEFQRVAVLPPKGKDAVLSHMRTVFSRNSSYFSVVLAAFSRMEKSAMELLPAELRTLMGARPAVSLPEMDEKEALDFLLERFKHFRPAGYQGPSAAPFGEATLRAIIGHIAGVDKGARMIPRTLFQALTWISDSESTNGQMEMEPKVALSLLKEMKWEGSG